jgi:hypothetical protein
VAIAAADEQVLEPLPFDDPLPDVGAFDRVGGKGGDPAPSCVRLCHRPVAAAAGQRLPKLAAGASQVIEKFWSKTFSGS